MDSSSSNSVWVKASKVESAVVMAISAISVLVSGFFWFRLCSHSTRVRFKHIIFFHIINVFFFLFTIIICILNLEDIPRRGQGDDVLIPVLIISMVRNALFVPLVLRPLYSWGRPRIFFYRQYKEKWQSFIVVFEVSLSIIYGIFFSFAYALDPNTPAKLGVKTAGLVVYIVVHVALGSAYMAFMLMLKWQTSLAKNQRYSVVAYIAEEEQQLMAKPGEDAYVSRSTVRKIYFLCVAIFLSSIAALASGVTMITVLFSNSHSSTKLAVEFGTEIVSNLFIILVIFLISIQISLPIFNLKTEDMVLIT